jgi:hypothetical protein
MEELKKVIVDNLYITNFYEALTNIKQLEVNFPNTEETLFFYYYLYDLMSWVSKNKQNASYKKIQKSKDEYFKKIVQKNQNDISQSYLQLYLFLKENFTKFDRFTWFKKYEKEKELLNHALQKDPNNLDAQFYLLFITKENKKCVDFLMENTLDTQIVQKFINNLWYKDEYLHDVQKLRNKYNLTTEQSELYYKVKKEEYNWLYKYFNENQERKLNVNTISYGKVCFELKKYDEAIKFYETKEDKSSNAFYKLGECYEKIDDKRKAIQCYKNYYNNFNSGYWKDGINKLFELEAYDEIKDILKKEKSSLHEVEKTFFEAKILNIEKLYTNSINHLSGLINKLQNHHDDLKKDIYFLYIQNNYELTLDYIEKSYQRIIDEEDFEADDVFGLSYSNLLTFQEMKKYIKKLNIEYTNKFRKKAKSYLDKIHKLYIKKIRMIYKESKKQDIKLSDDRKLDYLSAFKNTNAIKERINIYKNKNKIEPENPKYFLELGKLEYQKSKKRGKKYKKAVKFLEKSIELADKYFVNLDGEPELLLVKIKKSKEEKKSYFDKSIKDYLFYNSFQKDTYTIFFEQTLYKYQSFSLNALSSLSENYLYFSTPEQLNDPFDVASESLEKQFKNLKLNKRNFKLCSLSQINDNKLMWSHYTQEHRGICVGYKFLYLPNYVGKSEVKYQNTNLTERDIFNGILDYWIVKSEDWEYEQEVRLLHYGDKQKIHYTFDVNEAIEKNIIALQIESIAFGLKFQHEASIKPIILEIEKKQKRKINLFKVNQSKQKLVLEEVNEEKK